MKLSDAFKNKLSDYPLYWQVRNKKPLITQPYKKKPKSGEITFVMIVGSAFNQNKPNAETTCRIGLCNGFEKIGVPYVIISIFELSKVLDKIKNPVCWISGSDYKMLTSKNAKALKKHKHAVWVSHWFKGSKSFYEANRLPNLSWSQKYCKKILSTNPDFVFTPGTKSMLRFYEEWVNHGAKLVSLPLACDTQVYYKDAPQVREFNNIKMAFVGGYWAEKAKQFDKYLRPFEDQLSVFGYCAWPYKNYRGQLSRELEASLYKQALLSPAINEPQAEIMGGDICERVFKVLGSGGLAITDCVPAHYDIFEKNQLIVPKDLDDFKKKVKQILDNPRRFNKYRLAGHKAIIESHTYAHRAKTILKEAKINQSTKG